MTNEATLTDFRPHMVNAMYNWLSENRFTPYITVNAHHPEVIVPKAFVKDSEITLNISIAATQSLQLMGNSIRFTARFQGKSTPVCVPYGALKRIFAKENPAIFAAYENEDVQQEPPSQSVRPTLRVVK